MSHVRIGSLPWFAGVWWLWLAYMVHTAATGVYLVGGRRTVLLLCDVADRCAFLARQCAVEAGAQEVE